MGTKRFSKTAKVVGINDDLGLVFGWVAVSSIDGAEHFDRHGDCMTEAGLLHAFTDFMKHQRPVRDMHTKEDQGQAIFAFPLLGDIKKALNIQCPESGVLVGIQPTDELLAKFKSGEYTGFSLAGTRIEDEEVAE